MARIFVPKTDNPKWTEMLKVNLFPLQLHGNKDAIEIAC